MEWTKTEFVDAYMRSNNSKSPSTRRTMEQSINRIEKLIGKDFSNIKPSDFKYNDFLEKMQITYSVNTQICTTVAVIRFLTLNNKPRILKQYQDALAEMITKRSEVQIAQEKTASEKTNWIDYPNALRDFFLRPFL